MSESLDYEIDYDMNTTDITNQTSFDFVAEQVAIALNIYYIPVLVILGTFGNLFSVFVFFKSKLRLQSTSQYLSALAVSDTVFLLQLLPPWLNSMEISDLFCYQVFCQIFVYTLYVTCSLSAWLVVAFTVERFIAVLYPLQRNAVCSVTRARYIIFSIVPAALLLHVPVLVFTTPTSYSCNINSDYVEHAERFNFVDTFVSFTVPLFVIIVLNSWIAVGVWRLERERHRLMKIDQLQLPRIRPRRMLNYPRSQQRVTKMLLIVSSVFVVLNLPAYSMRILIYTYSIDMDNEYSGRWMALQQVALSVFNTNFGINFLLYCVSGQSFRRALAQTVPWLLRHRANKTLPIRQGVSFRPARASSVSTSFVSNGTDVASNCLNAVTTLPDNMAKTRRHARIPFVITWTFTNSRHSRASQQIEMNVFTVDHVVA